MDSANQGRITDLARRLLSLAYLLPAETMPQHAAFLGTASATGNADPAELARIGRQLLDHLEIDQRNLVLELGGNTDRDPQSPPIAEPEESHWEAIVAPSPWEVAKALVPLVQYATEENRKKNEDTLTACQGLPANAQEWGNVAFIAGMYCKSFDTAAMTARELADLTKAGLWAIQYEIDNRPENAKQRRNNVSQMISGSSEDAVLTILDAGGADLIGALESLTRIPLERLLKELSTFTNLRLTDLSNRLEQVLGSLPSGPSINTKKPPPLDEPPTSSAQAVGFMAALSNPLDHGQALKAIEDVWVFLDAKRNAENRRKLHQASQGDRQALSGLISSAVNSAQYRLEHHQPSRLPPEQVFESLSALTLYASSPRSSEFAVALSDALGLSASRKLASPKPDMTAITRIFLEAARHHPDQGRTIYTKMVEVVITWLQRQGPAARESIPSLLAGMGDTEYRNQVDKNQLVHLMEALDRSGAPESIDLLDIRGAVELFDEPVGGMGFLSKEAQPKFDEFYRTAQVFEIAELLEEHTERLLGTMSLSLASPEFEEYLPPTRAARVMVGNENKFSDFRRKALDGNQRDAREARDAFDRAQSAVNPNQQVPRAILREWRVYAAMNADSVLVAIPDWVEAYQSGRASDEEIWNLAVFHASQHEYSEALGFLNDRVSQLRSPYSHLRFAIYLAVQVLRAETAGSAAAEAKGFVLKTARWTSYPQAHLLWVALAHRSEPRPSALELSQGISLFKQLEESPVEIPPISLPGWPKDPRRLEESLNALRLKITKSCGWQPWRLWLNGYIRRNEDLVKVWQWWAEACGATGDANDVITTLRNGAQYGLRQYQRFSRMKGDNPARRKDRYVYFLREILTQLCQYAKQEGRDSLLREIYERWVREIPELLDPHSRNRNLQELLRAYIAPPSDEAPHKVSPIQDGASVWGQLYEPLFELKEFGDLTPQLVERIKASLELYPGLATKGRSVGSRSFAILATIASLQTEGVARRDLNAAFSALSSDIQNLRRDIESGQFVQLKALVEAFARLCASGARMSDSVTSPEVSVADGWIGFPNDLDFGQVLLEVRNPGPGDMKEVFVEAKWEGATKQSQGRRSTWITAGSSACFALDIESPASESTEQRLIVDVFYDWGLVTSNSWQCSVIIPIGDFTNLIARHGAVTQEATDPFVADGPLNDAQVRSTLFQGRQIELQFLRDTYGKDDPPKSPACFYGIRRTGKTSLLRRTAADLSLKGHVTVEMPLNGLRSDQMSTRELVYALLGNIVRSVERALGSQVPAFVYDLGHPSPTLLIEDAFAWYTGQGRPLTYLVDEFQLLIGPAAEPILDSLRAVYDRGLARFIFFANQGHDLQINTGSQLALTAMRVDFLSFSDVSNLAREPLADQGLSVHKLGVVELYEQGAGHPNFTAKLLKLALERVNQAHRNLLVEEDFIDAAKVVVESQGAFAVSWFSRQNLSPDEEEASIKFAKVASANGGRISIAQAANHGIELRTLRELEQKQVLSVEGNEIGIKGKLLSAYLNNKIAVVPAPISPSDKRRERVGLFVDLENTDKSRKALGITASEFAKMLREFAAREGTLQCSWAFSKPWHFGAQWYHLKLELEAAGLEVNAVAQELQRTGRSEKNLVDMMLNDQIAEEVDDKGLTRLVLVTGDVDHYMMVRRYLDRGLRVLLVGASADSVARVYGKLEAERLQVARSEGRSEVDFAVTTLDALSVSV